MLCHVKASSYGWVPGPTHVNKFRHGGKVPTFESQEPIKNTIFIRPRLPTANNFY